MPFPSLIMGSMVNLVLTLLRLGLEPELDLVREPANETAPAKGEAAVPERAVEVVVAVEVARSLDKEVASEHATSPGNYPILS